MENKREIGTVYEKTAAKYLERKGFYILERNFCSRFGEIDIIAKEAEKNLQDGFLFLPSAGVCRYDALPF